MENKYFIKRWNGVREGQCPHLNEEEIKENML